MLNSIVLSDLVYPIYRIGAEKPLFENGLCYFIQHKIEKDTDIVTETIKIVDDKNIDKPTLSKRRLILLKNEVPLKKLGNSIHFLGDLIKIAKSNIWFIDSSGLVFQYKKHKRLSLTFKKISKVLPIKGMGAIIEVEGISTRFKTLYEPCATHRYAGLLKDGPTYILYGIFDKKFDDTWRMV